jgi:ribosomal protein S4
MRRLVKYKNFKFFIKSKINHSYFSKAPKKVLNFKRTKWNHLQAFDKILQKTFLDKSSKFFINNFNTKIQKGSWVKLQTFFKDSLYIKNNLNNYFDNAFKHSFWKKRLQVKTLTKKDLFLSCLVLPEFRADILLWRLNFFNSVFQARQAIQKNTILVNAKNISSNYILKKGDIITVSNNIIIKEQNVQTLYPFIEFDPYTNIIVVISDPFSLKVEDCYYFVKEFFDLRKFNS